MTNHIVTPVTILLKQSTPLFRPAGIIAIHFRSARILGADWLPGFTPSRLPRCDRRVFGWLEQRHSLVLAMQNGCPSLAGI